MSHINIDNPWGPNPRNETDVTGKSASIGINPRHNNPFDTRDFYTTIAEAEERKRAECEAMEAKYPPNIGLKFKQMGKLCEELGAEAFKDMAPQMYGIYKEMKTIRDFQKMAKLLED